jgi:hypothetical protein
VSNALAYALRAHSLARRLREATPNEVKVAVTGYGNAEKGQVARMVSVILQLPEVPTPDDTADALATAICVASRGRPAAGDRRGRRQGAGDGSLAVAPIVRGETPYDGRPRTLATGAADRRQRRAATTLSTNQPAGEPAIIGRGHGGAVAMDSLVEVGGIGYRVFAAPAIIAAAQPGGRLKLHTYHLVREDQQALYGFRSAEELGFFTLLLTVTGVGPKVALAIVGSRPTADLLLAIMAQDQAVLVAIPGIGKKLAERIIFEP